MVAGGPPGRTAHAQTVLGAFGQCKGSNHFRVTFKMHWLAVSIVLSVLSQSSTKTLAVPVSRTSLQKNQVAIGEEDEPLYAYVYEYDDEENQIWSDCSKLNIIVNLWHSHGIYNN